MCIRTLFVRMSMLHVRVRTYISMRNMCSARTGGSKATIRDVLDLVMQNTVQETEEGLTMWAEMGAIYATTLDCRDVAQLPERIQLHEMYTSGRRESFVYDAIVHTQARYVSRRTEQNVTSVPSEGNGVLLQGICARAEAYARDLVCVTKALDEECEREMEKEEQEEAEQERQTPRTVPRPHRNWDCRLLFAATAVQDLVPKVKVWPVSNVIVCVCVCVGGCVCVCATVCICSKFGLCPMLLCVCVCVCVCVQQYAYAQAVQGNGAFCVFYLCK
jgi:hypothetical protein